MRIRDCFIFCNFVHRSYQKKIVIPLVLKDVLNNHCVSTIWVRGSGLVGFHENALSNDCGTIAHFVCWSVLAVHLVESGIPPCGMPDSGIRVQYCNTWGLNDPLFRDLTSSYLWSKSARSPICCCVCMLSIFVSNDHAINASSHARLDTPIPSSAMAACSKHESS